MDDLLRFEQSLGVRKFCLISVSIYGHDNRQITDVLRKLDGNGRAIVSFDYETITDDELDYLHTLGVRGVRVNLKTGRKNPGKDILVAILEGYARRCRPRDWVIQLYVGLEQIALVADSIPALGVRIVIDHMGSPDPEIPIRLQNGFSEILTLLRKGLIWVKISAPYRFATLPDLDDFGRKLISAGPNNVVWASDWPHTGGALVIRGGRKMRDYRQIDNVGFVRRVFEWCDFDQSKIQQLFVDNPNNLWSTLR